MKKPVKISLRCRKLCLAIVLAFLSSCSRQTASVTDTKCNHFALAEAQPKPNLSEFPRSGKATMPVVVLETEQESLIESLENEPPHKIQNKPRNQNQGLAKNNLVTRIRQRYTFSKRLAEEPKPAEKKHEKLKGKGFLYLSIADLAGAFFMYAFAFAIGASNGDLGLLLALFATIFIFFALLALELFIFYQVFCSYKERGKNSKRKKLYIAVMLTFILGPISSLFFSLSGLFPILILFGFILELIGPFMMLIFLIKGIKSAIDHKKVKAK